MATKLTEQKDQSPKDPGRTPLVGVREELLSSLRYQAAIQALYRMVREKDAKIEELRARWPSCTNGTTQALQAPQASPRRPRRPANP